MENILAASFAAFTAIITVACFVMCYTNDPQVIEFFLNLNKPLF